MNCHLLKNTTTRKLTNPKNTALASASFFASLKTSSTLSLYLHLVKIENKNQHKHYKVSKCGTNISDKLGYALCAPVLLRITSF